MSSDLRSHSDNWPKNRNTVRQKCHSAFIPPLASICVKLQKFNIYRITEIVATSLSNLALHVQYFKKGWCLLC